MSHPNTVSQKTKLDQIFDYLQHFPVHTVKKVDMTSLLPTAPELVPNKTRPGPPAHSFLSHFPPPMLSYFVDTFALSEHLTREQFVDLSTKAAGKGVRDCAQKLFDAMDTTE